MFLGNLVWWLHRIGVLLSLLRSKIFDRLEISTFCGVLLFAESVDFGWTQVIFNVACSVW